MRIKLIFTLLLLIVAGCRTTIIPIVPTASPISPTVTDAPSPTFTVSPAPTQMPTPTPTPTPPPTLDPTPTLVPTLSVSGSGVIAFASWESRDWQIYRINADGSGKIKLTVGIQGGYEPNWSPDGTKIIFQYSGLKIAEIAAGEISRIPLSVAQNNLPNEYLVKPAWSPDGKWIAFLNENGTQGDIYLIRPDGTDMKRLTDSNDISRDGNLVWSPDGKQLAYSAYRTGNIEIYVMDIAGALQGTAAGQQLTDSPPPVRNLVTSWSPDGSRLAFSSDLDGNTEIYWMNVDGSHVVRLTNHPASDMEPDWSPDGKLIAFSSNRDGNVEIYLLDVETALQNPDAARIRRLTNHPGDDVGPVWMPAP